MITQTSVPARKPGVLVQEAGGTVVLLDPKSGEYFSLDEVGGRIWSLCDGSRTIEEIVRLLCEEYETDPATAQDDLAAFLEELVGERLVSIHA